ncbi:MAG TPA: ATP-binding cassette domain-containing protein, partial [Chitinophagaceae bacterium]|nr:ATP-binding cassette domain-containing protein [Chitinophagaceae bacterium]
KVAIIGKTGSGKSTVAQLMLRMYDPQKGAVLYDGTDIRKMDLQNLRKQIAYVPQDVFLFSDSVENNIGFSYASPDHERVLLAAKNAAVSNEINDFPQQYQTMIGERGVTLSGGQKQRLSIARALLTEHEIVLFDDCLSAVDAKTENEIISNLYNYLHDKTAVIITHRIFSLFNFDKIIVLVDGAIAEKGTHRELMTLDGVYAEMYYNQQQQERTAAD